MAPKKDLQHTERRYTEKYAAQHNATAVKCVRILGKAIAAGIVAVLKLAHTVLKTVFKILSLIPSLL